MNFLRIEEAASMPYVFSNGAIIQIETDPCSVCLDRGEEVEPGIYSVAFDGKTVRICKAHAQQLLDEDEGRKEKDLFASVFGQ